MNIARWPLIVAAALLVIPARIDGITEAMTDSTSRCLRRGQSIGVGAASFNALRTPHITPATGERGIRDLINGATIEIFYNAPTVDDRVLPVPHALGG